jgi:hypothetical protein
VSVSYVPMGLAYTTMFDGSVVAFSGDKMWISLDGGRTFEETSAGLLNAHLRWPSPLDDEGCDRHGDWEYGEVCRSDVVALARRLSAHIDATNRNHDELLRRLAADEF